MTQPDSKGKPAWRPHGPLQWVGLVAAVIVTAAISVVLWIAVVSAFLPPAVPRSQPRPAATYDEALTRIDALESLDDASIAHGTRFFDQGSKVATAVVVFHGYTNNPKQFERIAEAYQKAGYNVLVPRLPGHGKADVMADGLSEVTPDALVRTIDESVDIAQGLGDTVQVVGLSGGGTMALWSGYQRDDVDRVVAIAPLMLPLSIPSGLVKPITVAARVIPDIHLWWDPRTKAANNIPPHRYPRFSIRSISAILDLSFDISDRPQGRSGALPDVVLINNESDLAVDIDYADRLFRRKIVPMAASAEELVIPKYEGYSHDLIDPQGMNADKIDRIYRELFGPLGLPMQASAPAPVSVPTEP